MKRIACVIIIVLLSTCIFSSVEPMSSVFGLTWQTSDTQYLRFGFASKLPETFGTNVVEPVKSLSMGNPVRQGTDVIVTNTGALYAFCEAYGNSRFDVKISAQDFALEGQEATIPFTVTWSNGNVESSPSASSASMIFSYQPNFGVYSQNRELRISASLPEQASTEKYTGYITLDLEVIE